MKNVYLISCTKNKQKYSCTAEEMYKPSAFFTAAMDYAQKQIESKNDQIHVLSPTYGLLYLSDRINTYDESLVGKSDTELEMWGLKVSKYLWRKHDLDNTNIVFLTESDYVKPVVPHLKHYDYPLKGLDLAQSTSWLQRNSKGSVSRTEQPRCIVETGENIEKTAKVNHPYDLCEQERMQWKSICSRFSIPTDIQLVTRSGELGIWISVRRSGRELEVASAKNHEPRSLIARRAIDQKEFEELYPYYQRWRDGSISRVQAKEKNKNCEYIFSLIHYLSEANTERNVINNVNTQTTKKIDVVTVEDDNSKCIVCKPSGYMLAAFGYDAYVISELLEYKLLQDRNHTFKVGFPYKSIDKVTEILSNYRINHRIKTQDKDIIKREFEDNDYEKFRECFNLISQKRTEPTEAMHVTDKDVNRGGNSGVIALWSKFTVRDCKSNERIIKTILPSYEIQEIKRHGGAYYGAGYESKTISDANPVEGDTISDDAPLTKSLLGHKAGETIIHSRGNGEIDLYLIEEIENHGIVYKSLKDATCNAEAEKNDGYVHIKNDAPTAKEIIKLPESEKVEKKAEDSQAQLGEENKVQTRKSNDELVKEAILTANSLIDIMLKLEIRDDITKQIKALIDLRIFLEK